MACISQYRKFSVPLHPLPSEELTTKTNKYLEDIVLYVVGVHGEQQRAGEIFVNIEKFDKQTKASVVI